MELACAGYSARTVILLFNATISRNRFKSLGHPLKEQKKRPMDTDIVFRKNALFARLVRHFKFGWGLVCWFHREAKANRIIMLPGNEKHPSWIKTLRYIWWKVRNKAIWWRATPEQAELRNLGDPELLREFLQGFDPESVAVIKKTTFYRHYTNLRHDQTYVFRTRLKSVTERDAFSAMKPDLEKEYYLPPGYPFMPEVFRYHHGLSFASNKILNYMKGKAVIDAGAYIGDSVLVMRRYGFSKFFSFDASKYNEKIYRHVMKMNSIPENAYEFIPCGVGAGSAALNYDDTGRSNTNFFLEGNDKCRIISVDAFCAARPDEKIGFIKADVEGFGLQMTHGMLETVRRDRPVMSLATYHSPDEFFGIKLLLEKSGIDYKYRMLHLHHNEDSEMALFAWPAELDENNNF